MKKILDKLKEKAKVNKKMVLFLVGLVIVGLITGSLFVTVLDKSDETLIKEYLSKFITNIDQNKLNYLDAYKNGLISNILFVIGVWLLGISVIGIPITIFMFFSKAFILGFSISSLIVNYKLKGCLLSFIYIFPHHILNIIVYIIMMIYSISLSLKIIDALIKKKTIDFKKIINKYTFILLFTTITIIITTTYEVFIVPNIIKALLPIIN